LSQRDAALACARRAAPRTRPDFIKASTSAFSEWHYIDLAYAPAGDGGVPPSCGSSQQNIVWALEAAAAVLRSAKSDGWSRSTMLRFLIHFMGDIHQARARVLGRTRSARARVSSAGELSSHVCAGARGRACSRRRRAPRRAAVLVSHTRRGDTAARRRAVACVPSEHMHIPADCADTHT
jgi:hypothetical protein